MSERERKGARGSERGREGEKEREGERERGREGEREREGQIECEIHINRKRERKRGREVRIEGETYRGRAWSVYTPLGVHRPPEATAAPVYHSSEHHLCVNICI